MCPPHGRLCRSGSRVVATWVSLREGPSLSTSTFLPTISAFLSPEIRFCISLSRANLSLIVSSGTNRSVIGRRPVPGRGREDERVGAVELGRRDDLERALEVVVGLAREADDDVGGHGEVGDRSSRAVGQPLEVALGGVAAVHGGAARGREPDCSGKWRCSHTAGRLGHRAATSRAACPSGAGW